MSHQPVFDRNIAFIEASDTFYPANASQESEPRLIANDQGHIIFYNQAFAELYGTQQNLEGVHIGDVFIFNDPDNVPVHGEQSVLLPHNQKELSLQFDWIQTAQGQQFLVASAEKVTAQEKLLQYVAEKIEQKQKLKSNFAPFNFLSFDLQMMAGIDGSLSTINHNFTQTLGYYRSDIASLNVVDLVHPDQQAEFRSFLQALKQNGDSEEPLTYKAACLSKQGEIYHIEWHFAFIEGQIYAAGHDVTLINFYRQSIEQQQQRLNEVEAIGHIGQWLWKVGCENLEFSDHLYKIFGVEKGVFNPTLNSVNDMIHRNDADRMLQVFERAIIERKDYDMDFRITRPDGDIRYIRCEGRCQTDQDLDVIALYGIMQDVTESMRRERDLREAKESVERAYAAKTQFLANMSHELRTPLNAVIGFSEMMERQLLGPIGNDKYLEYIKGIRESGEHLLDLISDILDMSKIEAGKYELALEDFNISKVVALAAHMMEGRALDSDIKIQINAPNDDLKIVADRRAVMQMILNLLSNAVKFSKQGGRIDIDIIEREKYMSIKVKDNGIGIPANKLANITMPFEQAESDYTRNYEGTGLGLAITKELAEIHGGSLHIESAVDMGTTVTIRLPYKAG
jgi:two-component system cell cycle sensor histidine kinase PleC